MNISGVILKRLRNNKDMTLEELVTDVNKKLNTNFSIKMIDKWENGKSEMKYENLKCMALYYKVTTDFLLGFDLDEFSDIIDLSNDLEIIQMIKELEEKCNISLSKRLILWWKSEKVFESYFNTIIKI